MNQASYKEHTIKLRKQGKTYSEIKKILKKEIPKSTLSNWCNSIPLSKSQKLRIKKIADKNIQIGRIKALVTNKLKRENYLKSVDKRIEGISNIIKNKNVKKIIASILYLGEGSKNRGFLVLGNSNPDIIKLFLYLLRNNYLIDESKFRCTIQCRADQNTLKLENFWSKITQIPLRQFYKTRIDLRTLGKPSKKIDYKGVCRIEYFSADLFIELTKIGELICKLN